MDQSRPELSYFSNLTNSTITFKNIKLNCRRIQKMKKCIFEKLEIFLERFENENTINTSGSYNFKMSKLHGTRKTQRDLNLLKSVPFSRIHSVHGPVDSFDPWTT